MVEKENEPRVDSTLSKGLAILEALATAKEARGVTGLSTELGLTKSNTFRLLRTLKALGYVKHNENKTYSATLKTWQIGRHTIEGLNLRELSLPEMNTLSSETGETIYLAVPDNLSVIYINKIDGLKPIRSWNPVGGSAPLHCVGTGKAILAANYDQLRSAVKGNLVRYTDKTITSMKNLDADIELTTKRGYAFDRGEYRERIISLGASICLPDGEAIAALGVSLPDVNLQGRGRSTLGKLVADAAAGVAEKVASSA